MTGQHQGYVTFRRKLVLGYGALGLLLIALLAWKTIAAYQAESQAARAVTAHSATAMAAHVAELLDAAAQPLERSTEAIARLDRHQLSATRVRPMLAISPLAPDARSWLWFIDANGRGVVTSNGLPVEGIDFSDRAYFAVPAASRDAAPFVGAPRIGAVSHRPVFFLSRRIESASGIFLGVIVATLDARRIAEVFDRARIDPSMSITLASRDNIVIARSPLFEQSFAADLSPLIASATTRLPASGTFAATSPFQGDRRMFSYVAVARYPLMIVVGVGRDALLKRLLTDFLLAAMAVATVLLLSCYSGKIALAQYRRLEHVEADQRRLIAQLASVSAELASGERRLRTITDHLPVRVAYINVDERFTFHNTGCNGAGAPLGASMGKTAREVFGPHLYEELKPDIRRALAGEQVCVEHACTVDGEERHFKRQYMPDMAPNGRVLGFYSMVTDITDFKRAQQRLSAIARVDSLTGLPNRAELLDRLDNALARCRRTGSSLACLYLDIDHFKEVNDTIGHSGGDQALIEFGRRLRQAVRESDLVARLAGDEFVILLEGLAQPAEARRVADKIIELMRPPFALEGTLRRVTTSIGVVIADPAEDRPAALLHAADRALYRAKRDGRNRVAIEAAPPADAPPAAPAP